MGTNAVLYSIGCHSDHHAYPRRACGVWQTRGDSPRRQHGYLVMIALALAPPLYKKMMQPKLDDWDRTSRPTPISLICGTTAFPASVVSICPQCEIWTYGGYAMCRQSEPNRSRV